MDELYKLFQRDEFYSRISFMDEVIVMTFREKIFVVKQEQEDFVVTSDGEERCRSKRPMDILRFFYEAGS
ncbi:hypothetical protein [Siphonobacter aquaeclarae]|jgi:hypothetical protein|uniref:Uncharacterized protein n=1 Tax=Siphonobacter aquaeclarae TaxID=563176 RepID=A0A1G9R5Y4_9BACT|nr:hypothetical protein [Siphonobacter aquaeclarae]SDM18722.1 hypothetical protein SAMN04488090_2760 [Siphonobacter aquaeclarae]